MDGNKDGGRSYGTFFPVKSSQIGEIAHKGDTLYVRFGNGKLYSYSPVGESTFKEFLNADSPGSYFHKNIKNDKGLKTERL